MLRSLSLRRPDLSDRRTQGIAGGLILGLVALVLVGAVVSENYLRLLLIGLAVLAPFLIVVALRRPYVFPYALYVLLVPFDNILKLGSAGTLTKLLGMATIAALVAWIFRSRRIGPPSFPLYAALVYLVLNLVGTLWTYDPVTAALELQTVSGLVLLYAAITLAPLAEGDLRLIARCVVGGGVAASLYGIYLLHQNPAVAGDYGRLMVHVGNEHIDPNHFGNALLTPLSFALVGLLHARRPAPLLAYAAAVLVLFGGIIISLSRETMLGAVLIAVVLIAFSRRRLRALAITVPTVAAIMFLVPAIGQRMIDAVTTGGAGRTFVWHVALRAWEQHPLFGWGTGSAVAAFDRVYLQVYAFNHTAWTMPPHDTLLHALVDFGFPGLLIASAGFVSAILVLRGIPRESPLFDLRVAATAALLGLGFVSFFIDLATYKYVWLALCLAAQVRSVGAVRASLGAYVQPAPVPPPPARPRIRRAFS